MATQKSKTQSPKSAEVSLDPTAEAVNPQVEATPEDAERIGTLGAILSQPDPAPAPLPEVEVGPVDVAPRVPQTMVIRVNENVDEMSIVAGGRRQQYKFEVGHQYRVPVEVAMELERSGRLYH